MNKRAQEKDSDKKDIVLEFLFKEVQSEQELIGCVRIYYDGRFDSISINSQIEDSSDIFTYIELEDKVINHPYSRLSIMKKDLLNPFEIKFKVITKHIPINMSSNAKFRATLIQEHKEIASDKKNITIKK